jgi:hypothetical protein
MTAIEHYFKALDLGHGGGPVSLEEARELLEANDDLDDPVCMTQDHRHRVLYTLIELLKEKNPPR